MVMKIAYIAPKSMAKHTVAGDFHFVIPQNATDWYKDSRNFKMLDNGAYEGKAIRMQELLDIARALKVDEVVIPDVIGNAKKTLENIRSLRKAIAQEFKVAAVPQGQTVTEFLECFKVVSCMDDIDTICFPKWLSLTRPAVVHHLRQSKQLSYKFEYHLMGLDNPAELFLYRGQDIRSVDTSMPFTYAYHYRTIELFEPVNLTRVPMRQQFDRKQLELLERNFKVLNDVVRTL